MMTSSTPQSKCNIDSTNQRIILNDSIAKLNIQKKFSKFFSMILVLLFVLVNNGYAQTYSTAGTYQWTCPAGVTSVQVQCWGGGGGGAGASSSGNLYVAGGGAGGNYSKATISVTPGTVYTVVVGAGGTGGSTNSTTGYGADGGTSSFATSLYASGGCGGWGGGAVIKAGLGGVNSGVKYTTVTAAGTYSAAPTTVTFGTAWAANTAYTLNQQISAANGKLYTVTVAGTSGSTTPTHTTGSATNGSATLTYAGVAATGSIGTSGSSPSIVVSYISITNPGSGYLTAPSVNISGGTATTAATATATINAVNVTGAYVYYLGGNGANGAYIASCTSNVSGAGGSSAGTGSNGNSATNASVVGSVCSTAVFTASAFGAAVTGGGAGAAGVTTTATNGTNATELGGGGSGAVGSAKTGGAGYQGQVIITYPTISNSGTLLAFTTTTGTASTSQSFTVSGTNMFAGITVTAPSGFEVSSDNTSFSSSVTIGAAGTITSTTVYVRLSATATEGSYNSLNIALSSTGVANVNVSIPNSTVSSSVVPSVSLSTTSLGTILGANSTEKTFTVAGSFISTNDITISAPTNFQVSTTSGSGFSSSVTLTPSSGTVAATTIYVRFTPTGSGNNSGNITVSCSSVSNQTVSVSGTLGQFYYQSGSLNSLSSWTSAADGSGVSPLDFTTDGVTFTILRNAITTEAWTVSGTGSKIMLGDPANAAVSLTIDSLYPITGTIDVAAASSGSNNLILKSSSYPTFGTLNAGSTVTYAGSRLTIASTPTYGNLAVTNIYDSVFLASNITVKDLTISGAGLLSIDNVVGASGKSLTIQGNVNLSGTGGIISRLNSGNNNTLVLSGTSKTITNTASGNNLSKTNITISGSYALNSNFDFVTLTNARTISGAGSLDISNYTLNLNYGNTTLSTIITNASSVIKTSEKTTLAPIPSGRTWNGLVEYAWPSGLQSVVAGTYNDLKLSNTSGADTVRGNIIVNGTLTTTSGGTLDLGTYSLSGTLGTIANAGTIKTSNLSSAPITSGKTWGGTINYASVNGGQSIVGGTFNNLTLSNTSGTDSAKSDIVVNGTLTTTEGGTFDMSTYALSGSLATVTNNGYLKTANISSTPLPTGKTWLGTVEFGGASTIMPSASAYNNVVITSSLLNVNSNITISGNLTLSGAGKIIGENSTLTRSVNIGGNLLVSGTGGITNTGGGQSFSFTLSGTGKTYSNTATNNNMNKTNFNITGSYALGSDITWVGAIASRYIGGSGSLDISGYTLDMGLGYLATSTVITNASSVIKTACPISQTNTPVPSGKTWNGTVRFTAATGLQAIPAGTYTNLQIDNTSGADSLRGDVTVNGALSLNAGVLATSSYKLIAAGSTTRSTGWVNGNLQKPVSTSGVVLFEIGDATVYSPASLNFNTVTTGGSLLVSTKKGIASQSAISSIGLNTSNAVNRYFTLSAQDGLAANYSGTYSFSNPSDIVGTVTISNLLSAVNTSGTSWSYYGRVSSSTSTSVTTNNTSSFGDVVFVSPNTITVTADAKVKDLGAADPVFTYAVTSGSLNAGDAFTGSLTRLSGDTAGIYPIQIGTLSISPNPDNYTINFVGANLIILDSDPIVTVSTSSLSNFASLSVGSISTNAQSFSLLGANLGSNNIVITAPQNFLVSLAENGTYTNSVSIQPVNGSVATTSIYVKYAPTGSGSYSGNIVVSCAANNITINNANISVSGYQNVFYYTGNGPISSLSSWSGTINGTGTSNPSNFTTAGVTYKIVSNFTTTEAWGISGAGSKIILGDPSIAGVTLTIEAGYPITGSIDVVNALSGSNSIVVKDANLPSLGTLDAASELHIQGNTTLSSSLPQLGKLFVDGVNNTLILSSGSNLTIQTALNIASGSTVFSQGTATVYTLMKSGAVVTINGYFKTSKSAGLVAFSVGSASSSLPAIQFIDAENQGVNFILGSNSTIEYSRDASGTTQNITARSDYKNLIISGNDNNKLINGPTTVAGTLTIAKTTGPSLNTITGALNINGTLVLADTLKRSSFINFANNATINRSTGLLDSVPTFAGSVNLIYSGTTALTTALECPSSDAGITNLTVSNSGGVTMDASKTINGTLTLTSGALIVGNKTLTLMGAPISIGSGSITTDSTSNISFGGNNAGPFVIPASVNSINNLTISNTNLSPVIFNALGSLTVKGTLNYSNDTLALGNNSLTINGTPMIGDGVITTTSSSNLTFGGNNAGPFNIPASVTSLNSITLNNTNAVPATLIANSSITAAGSLNLLKGTFNDNGNTISLAGSITGDSGIHIGSGKIRMTGSSKNIYAKRISNVEITDSSSISNFGSTVYGTLTMNGGNVTINAKNNISNVLTMANGSSIVRYSGNLSLSGGTFFVGASATDSMNLFIRGNLTSTTEFPGGSANPGRIKQLTIDSGYTYTMTSSGKGIVNLTLNGTLADGGATLTVRGNIKGNGTHTGTGRVLITSNSLGANISGVTFNNLELNNAAGCTSTSDITVNGKLYLTAGVFNTRSNKLIVSDTINRTAGWVYGKLQRTVASTGTYNFDLGDSITNYTPARIQVDSLTNSGSIMVAIKNGLSSQSAASSLVLNKLKALNRYYNVSNQDGLTGKYTGTFTFASTDAIGTPVYNQLVSAVNTSGSNWDYLGTPITDTTTTITNPSTSSFGDVVFASKTVITVTANQTSKNLGASDPVITYTVSGTLAPGDNFTGSLTRVSGEAGGLYAIQLGSLAIAPNSSNYTINFVSADFVIISDVNQITSFTSTHITDNRIRLSWNAPLGDYSKVLIFAKPISVSHVPTGIGVGYNDANSNIASAGVYSSDNYLVYAGNGTSVEVTGLTNATNYNFAAYTYNDISYSAASSLNVSTEVKATTSLSSAAGYQQTTLSWTNPTYYSTQSNYWDEVVVVAKAGTDVTQTPSGDASNYTANASFGLGTDLGDGNYVVYKGSGNSVTINGFKSTNQAYSYKTFVRHGSVWSVAQSITAYPIQIGDYSYKASAGGSWGTTQPTSTATSVWNTWNGSAWVAASVLPTSSNNVLILNGQTVISNSSSSKLNYCKNLTIDSGGVLISNSNAGGVYISVFGNSILVKSGGMVGTTATGNSADAISFALYSSNVTVSGGGTINVSRFRNDTTNVNLVIDNDVLLNYHGSTWAGNAGAYHSNSATALGNHTLTVNAGKTLTFAPWACITPVSSAHVNAVSSLTLNINGTMTFVDGLVPGNSAANGWTGHTNGYINMGSTSSNSSSINIGSTGVLNVSELYPNGTASDNSAGTGVVIAMNVATGGQLNVSKIADFRNASQKVTGGGTFNVMNGATLKIGSPDGITNTIVNQNQSNTNGAGQILTDNRTYNRGVNYSYEGTSIQVTGDGLPDSVSAVTINNAADVNLTNNIKVKDSLVLTSGAFITNNNVVSALGNTVKTNGWVAGNLQKPIETGVVSKTFEIGDASNYRPVTLTFGSVTNAGMLTARVSQISGAHPNQNTSMISSTKRLDRYWTFNNNGVVFTNYNAVFNFVSSDVLNNANTSNFIASNFNGNSWSLKTVGTKTSTSTQVTGLTAFNDYLIGESCVSSVVSNVVACDSYTFNGVTYTASTNATFSGTNIDGCDSTYNLNLTIKKSSTSSEDFTACDSYTWHGTTYLVSTTTTWTGVNAVGCDSVVTLNLTIKSPTSSIQTITACDSLLWNGVKYKKSTNTGTITNNMVSTKQDLLDAFAAAMPGDTVVVANGKYNWGNINISNANGSSSSAWIVVKAQSLNGVVFVGNTNFQFSGNRVHVTGFKFAGGNAGTNAVVAFRSSTSSLANYSRISNITVDNYNTPNAEAENEWVAFYGVNNRMDHCSFINKSNARATIVVWYSTAIFPDKSISTYHRIDSNYFSGRSYMGGNGGETIRVGVGNNSRTDGYNVIEYNVFENCTQTEPEIVSNKSCHNTYRYNTFKNCNGGLTLRMGKYCDVYGNSFIVTDPTKTESYGIRIIDKGHRVFNNYLEGLLGTSSDLGAMRSPIVIYNGHYPSSDSLNPLILNGTYIPADDALVAFNTIANCKGSGINIGYTDNGGNTYLPTGMKIANNVIKMTTGQAVYTDASNTALSFVSEGNIYDAASGLGISSTTGFTNTSMTLASRLNGILSPSALAVQDKAVNSSSYSTMLNGLDLQGQTRSTTYDVGCDELSGSGPVLYKPLDSSIVGVGKTTFVNQNSLTTILPKWIGVNSVGCDSIVYLNLTIQYCASNLNAKVFIEGLYNSPNNLNTPLVDILGNTNPNAADSVQINLWYADSLNNNNPAFSIKSVLYKNGTLNLSLPTKLFNKNCYIAIKHRNSMETWSAIPVTISGSTTYDFTTGLDKAYGDGINAPMKNMGGGVYALYSGNVDQDATIDINDMSNTENDAFNFAFGYNATDCNGDGASDALDMQLIENNAMLQIYTARPY